jgi:aminopeptidase
LIERRGAHIVLWGDPNVDLLDDVDPTRAGHDTMPLTGAMHGGGEVNWTFVPAPTSAAAWRIVGTDDVDALNERSFAALRFHGPGTNLKVGLMRGALWFSARFATTWGRAMIANMPSEEVFTTPDNPIAEGAVTATRPIPLVGGATVDGVRLRFENGRVVSVDADRNADALRSVLRSDPGAARLGEVALVDGTSPVGRSRRVFNDTLLDENATCHIARGNAIRSRCPTFPGTPAAAPCAGSTFPASTRTR